MTLLGGFWQVSAMPQALRMEYKGAIYQVMSGL
jgi:hypothetical protein